MGRGGIGHGGGARGHHHGGGGRGGPTLRIDSSIDPAWKNDWKFGLFDCCNEPALCASALPCTCYYCYHEKLASFLLNDRTYDPNSPGCGFVCCKSCCFDPCWCFFPSACAAQQLVRGVQNRYYIGSDVGNDCSICCRFWFCQACAMTQVLREINHRGDNIGGLGCAPDNNNQNPSPRAPSILFLNSAEIAIETNNFNTQAQAAMQNQTVAGQGNFVANRLLYLAASSSVAAMGGLAFTGTNTVAMQKNPMIMFAAMSQPADLQRYQMWNDMRNIYRQVQETQDGQWSSDQKNRYQGMEQEMLRPRAQVAVADPNQMMMQMGMMQMQMMQQQQPQQQMQMGMMSPHQQQIQLGMMPQQQQQPGFYSPPPPPPPPPPPQGNNNYGWNP